jgi:hypothetical protein
MNLLSGWLWGCVAVQANHRRKQTQHLQANCTKKQPNKKIKSKQSKWHSVGVACRASKPKANVRQHAVRITTGYKQTRGFEKRSTTEAVLYLMSDWKTLM